MFEPEVFRKQMYCIEESASKIVGIFRRPADIGRFPQWFGSGELRIVPPLDPPRYAPAYQLNTILKIPGVTGMLSYHG